MRLNYKNINNILTFLNMSSHPNNREFVYIYIPHNTFLKLALFSGLGSGCPEYLVSVEILYFHSLQTTPVQANHNPAQVIIG